jgi:hypothetical protein
MKCSDLAPSPERQKSPGASDRSPTAQIALKFEDFDIM